MTDLSSLGTLILGGGGLITGLLALFSARASKNKINSETTLNFASFEQSRENLHQSREIFWRSEVEKMQNSFESEVVGLREDVASLRILIENHVLWDWEVVRQLKLAGIEFRDPPSLNYIKRKTEEK
jgi:hypothetical protein